jgi:hypothetical protein
MRETDGITVGWVESRICEVIREGLISRFQWGLLTSIDSITELAESGIASRIKAVDPDCSFLGDGVVLSCDKLLRLVHELKLFTGFDEIWCFDVMPRVPKPPDLWLVAPLNIEEESVPTQLGSWMRHSECILGLGDGIGLNFATPHPEIAVQFGRLAR